jgi:hypothetical protein
MKYRRWVIIMKKDINNSKKETNEMNKNCRNKEAGTI